MTRALLESPDTDPFSLRVVDGISRELASLGYGVLLLPPITDAGTHKLHAGAIYDAAIVCQADVYAWGVSDAAKDLGLRVPEDVSITGFDGLTEGVFAELDLTSVVQDGTEKGRLIARWVTLACEGPDAPPPFDLPLSVRWGSTAGPAPQS